MFNLSKFSADAKDIAIDISDKRYSDGGMMWNELSLLTGIDMDTLKAYDDWYILDDGLYYFKYMYTIEELFISELAHECKVRCVEFLLALDNNTLGIMSKLYREKGKQYYMYGDFCKKYFNHFPDNLSVFRLASSIAFGEEKMNKLMDDVFSMVCFDIFTGQWDREEYNLFFECDSDSNVRIAPLCDNGVAFQNSYIYSSPFCELSIGEESVSRGNLPFILSMEGNFYNKLAAYLNINVSDILNRTCEKYKIDINGYDKRVLLGYFDDRKRAIEHTLKLSRNSR